MKTFKQFKQEIVESLEISEVFVGFDPTNRDHFTTAFDGTKSGSIRDGVGSRYHKLAAVQNAHKHPDGREGELDVLNKALEMGNNKVKTLAAKKLAKITGSEVPAATSSEPKAAAKPAVEPQLAKPKKPAEDQPKKIPEPDYVPSDDDEDEDKEKASGRVAAADMGPPHVRFRGHLNSALDQEGSHADVTFHDGQTHSIDKDHIHTLLSTVDAVKSPEMKQRLLDTARKGLDGFHAAHKAASIAISSAQEKAKEQLANKKKAVTSDFSHMADE